MRARIFEWEKEVETTDRFNQFVRTFMDDLTAHSFCRRMNCLSYTSSSTWMLNGSRHRCPYCGCVYRRWSGCVGGGPEENEYTRTTAGNVIDAQNILVCPVPEFMKGNADIDDITVSYYLVKWTDSIMEPEILNTRLRKFMHNLDAVHSMSDAELLEHVRPLFSHGRIGNMTKVPFNVLLRARIDRVNASAPHKWNYDHIKDGFLMGQADANMPILDQISALRMWALASHMQARVDRRNSV